MVDALFENPYQRVWGGEGEPPLPVYKVTLGSLLRGILPFGQPPVFASATARAVDAQSDLRWGPDRKGYSLACYTPMEFVWWASGGSQLRRNTQDILRQAAGSTCDR